MGKQSLGIKPENYKNRPIQMLRAKSKSLIDNNIILLEGQPAYELDTHKMKIGDGKTVYGSLSYVCNSFNTADQLQNFVDEVIEGYKIENNFYETKIDNQYFDLIDPQKSKLYVDILTNNSFRWGGNSYVQIGNYEAVRVELGENNGELKIDGVPLIVYQLPASTNTVLGGVIVNSESGLSVDKNGNISINNGEYLSIVDGVININKEKVPIIEETTDESGNKVNILSIGNLKLTAVEDEDGNIKSSIGDNIIDGTESISNTVSDVNEEGNVVETTTTVEKSNIGVTQIVKEVETKQDNSINTIETICKNCSGDINDGVGSKKIVTTTITPDGESTIKENYLLTIDGKEIDLSNTSSENNFATKSDIDNFIKKLEW